MGRECQEDRMVRQRDRRGVEWSVDKFGAPILQQQTEWKNTLGMRHRFRLGASPLLRFTPQVFRQSEEMARTLGNGPKSCDDYGFIQCVKRLFPTLQTEGGGEGQVALLPAPLAVTAAMTALFVMP